MPTNENVHEDPALTAMLPGLRPARVKITLKDGRTFEAIARTNKGDTEDPYSEAQVIEKFYEIAASVIGIERARQIEALVRRLDEQPSLAALAPLMEVA